MKLENLAEDFRLLPSFTHLFHNDLLSVCYISDVGDTSVSKNRHGPLPSWILQSSEIDRHYLIKALNLLLQTGEYCERKVFSEII